MKKTNPVQKADRVQRFLFRNTDIRGEIVTLGKSFQEATAAQNLSAELLPLFGEFLASAALLSEVLKFDGTLTLQARGDGCVPVVMAEATNTGSLRGIITTKDPAQLLNDDNQRLLPLVELVGKGVFTLTVDPKQGERYQGVVPLDGVNLADCIKTYFDQSEQLQTHLVLFSNETHCGGLFLQCLPQQHVLDSSQRDELWLTAQQLAATLGEDEFFNTDHETLLFRLFHELEVASFEAKPLQFQCSCSRERSENALRSLGEKDLMALSAERPVIEIDCEFCGQQYQFDAQDVNAIVQTMATLH